uniref:C-type lectin domain-containing protein n=1 Tax=Gasterosteus aculeatus aculeatus TaxID=481459 RepID=A0AAQ4RS57_GASAC
MLRKVCISLQQHNANPAPEWSFSLWVDSSPVTYTHWGPGEPNNANGEEQYDIKANWSHARTWCKAQGGELAILSCPPDFVASYLRDLELPTWIGLSDLLVENQYAWSDGVSAVLYTNWNEKEPNNAGGTEHCVAMAHGPLMSGKWNDDVCHKDHSFVCSRRKCQLIVFLSTYNQSF